MTTALAIIAVVTAVSLVTASSSSGLATSAFAVKKVAAQALLHRRVKKVHLVQVVVPGQAQ
jgi:hypothetical protein